MARLIDAYAWVTVKNFDPEIEVCYHDEMTVEQALDFATDEGCPPTIDAIPVEWLKDKMQKPQMTDGNPFGFVLAEWLEEQEAR